MVFGGLSGYGFVSVTGNEQPPGCWPSRRRAHRTTRRRAGRRPRRVGRVWAAPRRRATRSRPPTRPPVCRPPCSW
ncbi:hypothetical protein NKG94_23540 [Micromonospora sp. M12]